MVEFTVEDFVAAVDAAMAHERSSLADWYQSGVIAEALCRSGVKAKDLVVPGKASAGTVSKCRTIARKWSSVEKMERALSRVEYHFTIENAYELAKAGGEAKPRVFSAAKVASSLESKYTKAQLRKIVAELSSFLEG